MAAAMTLGGSLEETRCDVGFSELTGHAPRSSKECSVFVSPPSAVLK